MRMMPLVPVRPGVGTEYTGILTVTGTGATAVATGASTADFAIPTPVSDNTKRVAVEAATTATETALDCFIIEEA